MKSRILLHSLVLVTAFYGYGTTSDNYTFFAVSSSVGAPGGLQHGDNVSDTFSIAFCPFLALIELSCRTSTSQDPTQT